MLYLHIETNRRVNEAIAALDEFMARRGMIASTSM
jgi:hypothetical protein